MVKIISQGVDIRRLAILGPYILGDHPKVVDPGHSAAAGYLDLRVIDLEEKASGGKWRWLRDHFHSRPIPPSTWEAAVASMAGVRADVHITGQLGQLLDIESKLC